MQSIHLMLVADQEPQPFYVEGFCDLDEEGVAMPDTFRSVKTDALPADRPMVHAGALASVYGARGIVQIRCAADGWVFA